VSRTKRASRSRWTQPSTLKSSSWSVFCSVIYFAITSSVTLPEVQQKYPRAHKCLPQNCVVLRHVPFHDRYLMMPADLTDQVPHPRRYLALERRPAILHNPHQMQVEFEYCMRPSPVFRHPQSLSGAHALKPSPEGEGFNPPSRRQ
jgi:hypothetical protein